MIKLGQMVIGIWGAALGFNSFREEYILAFVGKWKGMLQRLTQFSKSHPHAAYSAFTHGFRHKFTYFMRTMELGNFMGPLDELISNEFIPSLFGGQISPSERKLISLPVKYGGMGIPILTELDRKEYSTSVLVTRGLVDASNSIIDGDKMFEFKSTLERQEKDLRRIMEQRVEDYSARRELLIEELSTDVASIFRQLTEPSASNWLSCLPLQKYGFVFHKSDFRDCVRLRYGKEIDRMPDKCAFMAKFDINNALNCHLGGFINIRHNEIRNFIGGMISRVHNDVQIEPELQPLHDEQFHLASTLTADQARPDVRARGFYRAGQQAYFDVKVLNPYAESYSKLPMKIVYDRAEKQKIRANNDRILNVEHRTFVPLIFSTSGGMGHQAETFVKLLCNKISTKNNLKYDEVINVFRCRLSFIIRRLVLLCIRGTRKAAPKIENDLDDGFVCFASKLI